MLHYLLLSNRELVGGGSTDTVCKYHKNTKIAKITDLAKRSYLVQFY